MQLNIHAFPMVVQVLLILPSESLSPRCVERCNTGIGSGGQGGGGGGDSPPPPPTLPTVYITRIMLERAEEGEKKGGEKEREEEKKEEKKKEEKKKEEKKMLHRESNPGSFAWKVTTLTIDCPRLLIACTYYTNIYRRISIVMN